MLESVILQTTKRYLFNYSSNFEVISEWSKNEILGLPMLVISYSTNKEEADSIRRKKEKEIRNILVASTDIVDDTSEDLL